MYERRCTCLDLCSDAVRPCPSCFQPARALHAADPPRRRYYMKSSTQCVLGSGAHVREQEVCGRVRRSRLGWTKWWTECGSTLKHNLHLLSFLLAHRSSWTCLVPWKKDEELVQARPTREGIRFPSSLAHPAAFWQVLNCRKPVECMLCPPESQRCFAKSLVPTKVVFFF